MKINAVKRRDAICGGIFAALLLASGVTLSAEDAAQLGPHELVTKVAQEDRKSVV